MVYQKSVKLFAASVVTGLMGFILLSSFSNFNLMEPITSRYNLQNKIGKGGYYLESVEKGNIVYFDYLEFQDLKNSFKSKNENNLTHYKLPKTICFQMGHVPKIRGRVFLGKNASGRPGGGTKLIMDPKRTRIFGF